MLHAIFHKIAPFQKGQKCNLLNVQMPGARGGARPSYIQYRQAERAGGAGGFWGSGYWGIQDEEKVRTILKYYSNIRLPKCCYNSDEMLTCGNTYYI